jgi:ribosomal protein S18 acetylase RimI-like enzyme
MSESLSQNLDIAADNTSPGDVSLGEDARAPAKKNPSDIAIELRPAAPDDESFLYELYCSTRADEIAAFGWDRAQQAAFLQLQFRGLQRHYQVQQLDVDSRIILRAGGPSQAARPIGQIIVMRSATEIRLADIALLPEYRGSGIGTALIRDLFAEATASSRPVTLHVEKSSRAVGFYERLGFVKTGDTGFHYKMEWKMG